MGCAADRRKRRHGAVIDPSRPADWPPLAACEECGDDDPAEDYRYCLDCLEALTDQGLIT